MAKNLVLLEVQDRKAQVEQLRVMLREKSPQLRVDILEPSLGSRSTKGSLAGMTARILQLPPGRVCEWIVGQPGCGAAELALLSIQKQLADVPHANCLLIDSVGDWYAPALEQRGIDLSQLVMVTTRNPDELLWVAEQGLRSRGIDMVWCRLSRVPSVALRRLQLAAEEGSASCLLLRDVEALHDPSWADVRLMISGLPSTTWNQRQLRIEVLKLRQGLPGTVLQIELDHETGTVRVVSELVDSAVARRAAPA